MITKLQHGWQAMRSSFWFVPALLVVDAVVLAILLITLDMNVDLHLAARWPLLFGAGAAGARGLLTTVAGSMITVAGLVFSITLVALSLTSSQYSSRVIRTFMRDRINQWVLGVFLGIFAYCLVVLRTIRGGDEEAFVPALAVWAGLMLAFVGIAVLIHFIHHIATSIQASSIVSTAALETLAAVDHLFPEASGETERENTGGDLASALAGQPWSAVPASKTGYIESLDADALRDLARSLKTLLRMERGVGEFVVAGTPLISLIDPGDLDASTTVRLNAVYVIGRQRTVEQDVAFGIRQIVDVAMKALSPGINDTTTAVMCVDYLAAILTRLAARRIATPHWLDQGALRVIIRGPSFESLLGVAFDQIRQNAEGNVAILLRLLGALHTIAGATPSPNRRRAIGQTVDAIAEAAERRIASPSDRDRLANRLIQVRQALIAEPVSLVQTSRN
ncbi:DUF2254 domain-containing protein [Allochromatium vinosum]|uniref:DUF2254 domain-containing protein n=1 Tax=Allochromatium vinosum (strain ATCC 17899 / DSM 180 / NBRC 103801 / NCIMB 10441 / D) TaxID=572477 RepID=D3RSE6_ALLVD|nr:DUF2254 domain-containing protein [Allochromatium vinosum]ADC62105.1 Protein of unknown function DUF2254, membrane [Allochromatium vinosum DSM 180]